MLRKSIARRSTCQKKSEPSGLAVSGNLVLFRYNLERRARVAKRFQTEQWVPFPVDRVFLFFANPNNLPRIMPPSAGTRLDHVKLVAPPSPPVSQAAQITSELAGVGSEIVTSFRILPFLPLRAKWIALITEFEWNHHFADIQKKGPFKSFHHRHELVPLMRDGRDGTIVRDIIDLDVGFGVLGAVVQTLFAGPELKKTFAHRQSALQGLLSE